MRKFVLIITVLAMLCVSGGALAQDTTMQTFCGDLSDADCQILTQSEAAMKTVDSATFDFGFNVQLSNLPGTPSSAAITLNGSGAYSGVQAIKTDPAAMMQDYGAFLQNVFDNFDGSLTLTITVPPELMSEADPSAPNSITLDLRLVDGVGYLNLDELQPLINDPSMKGWGGLDIANFLRDLIKQNPNMFDFSSMMNGMNGVNPMSYMQDFQDPSFLSQFLTINRTDDGSGDTATFEMTLDMGALMNSPQIQDMLKQQMQAQSSTMSEQDVQQAMAMVQQMYQGVTMTITEEIGTTDYYVRHITGTFNLDLSNMMSAMNDMSSNSTAMSTEEAAPIVDVTFTLNYDNFNNAPAITAPDNVSMLPYQMFLGMAGSMATPTVTLMPATPTATTPMTEPTAQPTEEMTMEPTVEATSEMTVEPPIIVTPETTAEVTVSP